ncbi:MAG: DUF1573 domain-containing protein [Bacteroidota bacterium]
MKRSINLFLFSIIILITACQPEKSSEKSIEEIRNSDLVGNAAIIRNPVSADEVTDTVNVAKMEFEEPIFEFGEVEAGEIVTHTFDFRNTGKVPLLISDARSTCGCTVPDWPEELIHPGEKGQIKVKFNTKNMLRMQKKPVTVVANTYPSETKVYLSGFVREKKEG